MHLTRISIVLATALAGCTNTATNDIDFHNEQPVLPGFNFDSGLVPTGSPVQLRLAVSAGGAMTATAKAIAGGDGSDRAVVGTPGSGAFTLDAHVKLDSTLKVDVAGLSYDGPIPGIENVDVAFGGKATFDPFLVGKQVHVIAKLPRIELPPIPLPGGLPGHLQLTVTEGSTIDVGLAGTCAGFTGSTAQWHARTSTTAHVVIAPSIVLTVPIVGDKTFAIPDLTVDIPALAGSFDFADHEFAGGGVRPPGTSVALENGCSGAPMPPDSDPANCTPSLAPGFAPVWHPPNGSHADVCTTGALSWFEQACLDVTASQAACDQFRIENAECMRCLVTTSDSPGYGPIVKYPSGVVKNFAGCVALVAPDYLTCAKAAQAHQACIAAACACGSQSCIDAADRGVCRHYADADSSACYVLPGVVGENCLLGASQINALFCGP